MSQSTCSLDGHCSSETLQCPSHCRTWLRCSAAEQARGRRHCSCPAVRAALAGGGAVGKAKIAAVRAGARGRLQNPGSAWGRVLCAARRPTGESRDFDPPWSATVLEESHDLRSVLSSRHLSPCPVLCARRVCEGGCKRDLCLDCTFTLTSIGQLQCWDCAAVHG